MKSAFKTLMFVSFLVLVIPTAQADTFVRAPETYAPVWYTAFPYQRNINMLFAVTPVGSPGSGIPGAIYEGWLDPSLLDSDYVLLTGDVSWYASLSGITETGLVGIDNRLGSSTLTGTALFHIDNTTNFITCKNFWYEEFWVSGGGSGWTNQVYDPDMVLGTYLGGPADTTYDGKLQHNGEWQITPNPTNETLVVSFSVAAGQYMLLDGLHIATECVPEPSAIALLALGGLVLLWRRRS
jgi:hypothetical protein